ncbi:hypothetical protein GCM10023230_16690 [Flavobacterium hankyongi]|uniref:Uncharacterized protein n=1 Tax=Flavobacterium hankyongi TaxID=1176532 RepID=A0ABP8ZWU4_9FLAO
MFDYKGIVLKKEEIILIVFYLPYKIDFYKDDKKRLIFGIAKIL